MFWKDLVLRINPTYEFANSVELFRQIDQFLAERCTSEELLTQGNRKLIPHRLVPVFHEWFLFYDRQVSFGSQEKRSSSDPSNELAKRAKLTEK
jgi:hypothetical protein